MIKSNNVEVLLGVKWLSVRLLWGGVTQRFYKILGKVF